MAARRRRRLSFKIALAGICLLLGLGLAELGVRAFELASAWLRPDSAGPPRALLFSSATFALDANRAVRYVPNEVIRTIAIYDGEIDYDVRFRTNNLGFVDERDYGPTPDPNAEPFVFVGDSFTAGYHGGKPWVPGLRDIPRPRPFEVYNLGVDGTGMENFSRLLHGLRDEIPMSTIVVVAITNDFERGVWWPEATDGAIRFCADRNGATECAAIARIVPIESSDEQVKAIAREMTPPGGGPEADRLHGLRVLALARDAALGLGLIHRENPEVSQEFAALRRIRNAFPESRIVLVHLPERGEVIANRYNLDLRKRVESVGVVYVPTLERCEWSKDMYFKHDGHPNALGYRNISDCVTRHCPEIWGE